MPARLHSKQTKQTHARLELAGQLGIKSQEHLPQLASDAQRAGGGLVVVPSQLVRDNARLLPCVLGFSRV